METSQLKRIPLFSDAADEDLRIVAQLSSAKEFDEGRVIIKEGAYSNDLMAIEEGTVEVTRDGEKLADLGQGDIFGEAGLLDDTMRAATVTATSPLKVISIGHFEVKRLKKNAPEIYKRIEQLVEERKQG
jgi:CRP/FNR family transcriptional regulator, cyclic AMP receptor protein